MFQNWVQRYNQKRKKMTNWQKKYRGSMLKICVQMTENRGNKKNSLLLHSKIIVANSGF
jgi:hypothetical protein